MDVAPTDSDQSGEKPSRPLQPMKGWEVLGQPPSFEQQQPWVFLNCGSQYMQNFYVINSMGGRERESVKKGYIHSWKPWERKKRCTPFPVPIYTYLFSQHVIPAFSSVLLHALIFLKAAVPVTGCFVPSGWMPTAVCWVTHVWSSQFNCLKLQSYLGDHLLMICLPAIKPASYNIHLSTLVLRGRWIKILMPLKWHI